MKYLCFAGAALMALGMTSQSQAMTTSFTPWGFTDYQPDSTVINFDDPTPANFTVTGDVRNVTDGNGAEPGIAPGVYEDTNYLVANLNKPATVTSTIGYRGFSVYWGSIDKYNTISFLKQNGDVFKSYAGSDLFPGAFGGRLDSASNARVYFNTEATDPAIYGVRFESTQPAFEVDNLAFSAAVPEPASWAMMIGGFGFVGGAMRRRAVGGGFRPVAA